MPDDALEDLSDAVVAEAASQALAEVASEVPQALAEAASQQLPQALAEVASEVPQALAEAGHRRCRRPSSKLAPQALAEAASQVPPALAEAAPQTLVQQPSNLMRGGRDVSAEQLEREIRAIVAEHPAWGVRKVWATLRQPRHGLEVSQKRVGALMSALGLCSAGRRPRTEAPAS